jgi:hydroxymethylglutaryl-CoA synthase
VTSLGAILRCGVHVPRLRLARASIAEAMAWTAPKTEPPRGERAICNWDEDALTMAVEASRGCLADGQGALPAPVAAPVAAQPRSALFCSTTAPFADRDQAVLMAAALDLPEEIETLNVGSSLRAGTSGLLTALRRPDPCLVAVSDMRLTRPGSAQELTYGDAAVAFMVGPAAPHALATVLAAHSLSSDFVDHYRMARADFDYALEERWVRDESLMKLVPKAIATLLATAGASAASVRHFMLPASASAAKRIAQSCGIESGSLDSRLLAECGDAGAATALLMLAGALDRAEPGSLGVLVGLGQGVDALLLRFEAGAREGQSFTRALARKRSESSYVRYLSHRGLIDVDFGMRAERDQRTAHTVAYRKRRALEGFVGGRCERCAAVQFPLTRVCVNPDCRATDTQVPFRLAESSGRIKSFTEDWQAFALRPPYCYGNVEFAAGGNLLMEFTDIEPGELAIGDEVRFVFRIKDEDRARGFRRYFWKATKV